MRRKRALAAAAALLLVSLAVGIALSWHNSSTVLVPDHAPWSEEVDIEAVGRSTITLDSSEAAQQPGRYGLVWQAGHAVVGPILAQRSGQVVRRLSGVHGYLVPGLQAGLDSSVYSGNPREGVGLPFREVRVRSELGPMPAWLIPGERDTWAIFVHGINGSRQNGLQFALGPHALGMPTLLISYRNDLGAPESPDGLHHLGLTEWRDLQAATRFALDRGARKVVLIGHSMGGAVVGQFMQRSSLASRVAALVLDAPVLDWRSVLAFNASERGYPSIAALPLRWAIGARIDVDWDSLDLIAHPESLGDVPILLFHGTDDHVVPIEDSEELAAELGSRVTYLPFDGADHVCSWNVDSALYERRLRAFLVKALQTSPKQQRARPVGSGSR